MPEQTHQPIPGFLLKTGRQVASQKAVSLQLHSLGSCGTQASLGPLNSIDSGKSPEVPSCFPTLPSAKVSVTQKPQQVSFVGRRVRIYTFPFEFYQNGSSPCNSDNCSHPVSPLPPSFHLLLCIYPGTVYSAHSVPSNLGTAWGTRTEARKSSQTRFWQRTSGHGCSWWRGWSRGSGGLAPVTPKSGKGPGSPQSQLLPGGNVGPVWQDLTSFQVHSYIWIFVQNNFLHAKDQPGLLSVHHQATAPNMYKIPSLSGSQTKQPPCHLWFPPTSW